MGDRLALGSATVNRRKRLDQCYHPECPSAQSYIRTEALWQGCRSRFPPRCHCRGCHSQLFTGAVQSDGNLGLTLPGFPRPQLSLFWFRVLLASPSGVCLRRTRPSRRGTRLL